MVQRPEVCEVEVADEIDPNDYVDICSFCAEVGRRHEHNLLYELMPDLDPNDFILFESDDFVVIPGVGSICDGYVLVVPKAHVLSFGHLEAGLDEQLRQVFEEVARWIGSQYGLPVIAFEHGAESFRNRGGSCTDHAHMHLLPASESMDIVGPVGEQYDLRPVNSTLPALRSQVTQRRRPYLWLRDAGGRMWICDAPKALSQYLRRILLSQLGRPDEWDWATFPGTEHMRATLQRRRITIP